MSALQPIETVDDSDGDGDDTYPAQTPIDVPDSYDEEEDDDFDTDDDEQEILSKVLQQSGPVVPAGDSSQRTLVDASSRRRKLKAFEVAVDPTPSTLSTLLPVTPAASIR